ncbi:glycosyltransferase family 2 protein [Mangrovibacterium diazotrophicum]|uniref:Glycosyltransferase 2-like domain-containing protein n=1 Tax=Mangrovibacterium diazotrophicum TaxID=1261403 RepID=A0A419W6U9_9BACT|nr:glycosyltransferase family 2 protein [Mangrovibacterium diazotrophicum]RKD91179.1 hypothetical protein BC643_1528 [Mangrovibacterium diazotrophicum]
MVKLSVIIVNYRGWKHLGNCLESLQGVASAQNELEVIVVDNCSNDGKLDEFKQLFPFVRFILNSGNNGFSNGCNVGAAHASGSYFLFMNSDIIANKEAIWGMLEELTTRPNIMLLSCRQKNNAGKEENPYNLFPDLATLNGIPRSIYKKVHKRELAEKHASTKELIFPDWVSGSVMMISADHFRQTGGWCEDYWLYYEDVELCRRVCDLGGKVALTNKFSMIHNHGGATRINPKTAALTKAEVRISKHVYVSRHFTGLKAFVMHLFTIIGGLIGKLLPALLSIPFFFNRKLRAYGRLYVRLLTYYFNAIVNRSWMSPRAMNFKK